MLLELATAVKNPDCAAGDASMMSLIAGAGRAALVQSWAPGRFGPD